MLFAKAGSLLCQPLKENSGIKPEQELTEELLSAGIFREITSYWQVYSLPEPGRGDATSKHVSAGGQRSSLQGGTVAGSKSLLPRSQEKYFGQTMIGQHFSFKKLKYTCFLRPTLVCIYWPVFFLSAGTYRNAFLRQSSSP